MPALNNVQLIGRLGKDPETRFTPNGKKVCQFTLAVGRRNSEEPDWFIVEAWERLGEVCQQYLVKGRLIYVEGRLRTHRWDDDKGETHYITKVVARGMQMLDRKPEEQEVTAEGEAPEA
ncbi:MAG TPA: single-stranded DNA-binding protein [Anaerolineales bacterium]|nr:single-stranded DNA-binding protein [Anaerolineales bacterium]